MKPISPCPKPSYVSLSTLTMAAAMSCGLLLTACGGGGGGSSPAPAPVPVPAPPPPAPAPTPVAGLSQADATADAANATESGSASTAAIDEVFDSTVALNALVAVASPGAAPRAHAQHATAQGGVITVTNEDIACPGGGTATLSISGGTVASEQNDVLDAGENYSITYTNCARAAGLPTLNGQATLDVVSISSDASPVTAVTITTTNLALTLPQGSVTANGSATLSRSSVTANGSTTTTSAITAGTSSAFTLATSFNSRTGSYSVTNLNATRTATSTASGPSGSSYSGTHTLAGTANARTFSFTSATNSATTYDATGTPTAGDWLVTRSDATIHAVVSNGSVTLTVDDTTGALENTFTFPVATLVAAAG
jgi:hypothetical protein